MILLFLLSQAIPEDMQQLPLEKVSFVV